MSHSYPRIAALKTAAQFEAHVTAIGATLPFDVQVQPAPDSPLAAAIETSAGRAGNRFSILPMEGWDGTTDGRPTDLTRRRWQRFGESGAKLIWGGEAFAVRHDGRANPNQLCLGPTSEADLVQLREDLFRGHRGAGLETGDLVVGLQLTHSGRYARPDPDKQPRPLAAYPHPVLDRRVSPDRPVPLLSDDDLDDLSARLVQAAALAQRAGFTFVDIKHCHGYLGHELLSARTREGRFGGDFVGRTRLLRQTVEGIRRDAPGLAIGVRLSAFDTTPFRKGEDEVGEPEAVQADYAYAFGRWDGTAALPDLSDTRAFLTLLTELGVDLVCLSAGSPYYNPHIQRPATFPPSDGYLPPEDPLMSVARQIAVTAALKQDFPTLRIVGSAYSYLQEWLPNVGQAVVRTGGADFIGLGRMVLSYPEMPLDVLRGQALKRKSICRTFSDCTTGPRNGLVSGCFPLDPFYTAHPDHARLKAAKAGA
ncbi:NADPH dehydrogenase [Luteitalea pratensis]|uniref:NADPH dehydrogenase n=1 Tax=Luteitalea pratensis TaxID=1855912 RepID=A0A143PTI5_LUTPR|nr:NADH:flavin oxidoreductase [Luteitalea pratensis]AMY11400.1 NADPH dehydrogenase [Luteitalea pratensis]